MTKFAILLAATALATGGCGDDTLNGNSSAPTVVAFGPARDAVGVARNAAITATFDKEMQATSITSDTFTLRNGDTVIPGVVTYTGVTAKLVPSAFLTPGTDYTATISTGAMSATGSALGAAQSWTFTTVAGSATGPSAVNLATAANYAVLAKSGVSTTGPTSIVGHLGLSPAAGTLITGFALSSPATTFTTSLMVTGQVFAANYDAPTPAILTAAVLDMQGAYTNAAGRTLPDFTELGAGNIQGLTLAPGLYRWGTGVTIPAAVTLSGGADDVWIFQIAQDLTVANDAVVTLVGGAQARNVFWQVGGAATLGTASNFQGILLSKTLISLNTGAVMTGRALAQTAVTLNASTVTNP